MLLPRALISNTCDTSIQVTTITDSNTGLQKRFAIFGEIDFKNARYLWGCNFCNYLYYTSIESKELPIELFKVSVRDVFNPTFYSATDLSSRDKKTILNSLIAKLTDKLVEITYPFAYIDNSAISN